MPSIHIGGGENATKFAVQHTNPQRYQWCIVVVTEPYVTWDYLWQYAESVPVYYEGFCYFRNEKKKMQLDVAMNILRQCDGVIAWELDEKRAQLFNSVPGKKIHWIFRHDTNHWKWVRENHILLTCSESCRADFGQVGNREIHIIPSQVDFEHCRITMDREEVRSKWNCDNRIVVGYIGRMDLNKNIQALARTVAGRKDMQAVCYGVKSWDTAELEKQIFNIANGNLQWHNAVLEVGNILNGFDVMISPSYSEVFSLSILEAWATKTPVVCTNVGEVPALQEKYGQLCTLISPDAEGKEIREAVWKAMEDTKSVERAYRMVKENYSAEIVSKKWNDFFDTIFESKEN